MKMQEVILRLRELAPEAEQNVDLAVKDFYVMQDLLRDLQACVSSSTREAVLKLIDERQLGLARNQRTPRASRCSRESEAKAGRRPRQARPR